MPAYHRTYLPGGSFFFTLVTNHRRAMFTDPLARDAFHAALVAVQSTQPFQLEAICLLPDHLHCIWTLPPGDADFSTRWKRIKALFSRGYRRAGGVPGESSTSKLRNGEAGFWQRRFWEHTLSTEEDFHRHLDYLHFNPVKHGWVRAVSAWPWSSFHRYVQLGYYPADWGTCPPDNLPPQDFGE